jgi:hypothetical protein
MRILSGKVACLVGFLVLVVVSGAGAVQVKVDEDTWVDFGAKAKIWYLRLDERSNGNATILVGSRIGLRLVIIGFILQCR